MAAEGTELAQREVGGVQAAGGGDEVIRTRGQAGKAREVDDDVVGGDGRGGRGDPVVARQGTDIEPEGGGTGSAGAEVENAGTEGDRLADGVVKVEDRARGHLDGGRPESGGLAAGDVQATAEDGGLAHVGERGAAEREGTEA